MTEPDPEPVPYLYTSQNGAFLQTLSDERHVMLDDLPPWEPSDTITPT